MPRTNKDKRRAVLRLLEDAAWRRRSDRAIARHCRVDHKFVGKLRKELTGNIPISHGTTATMQIGPKPTVSAPPPSDTLLTGEMMASVGISPACAQRILARLAVMPPGRRQQAERVLCHLLI